MLLTIIFYFEPHLHDEIFVFFVHLSGIYKNQIWVSSMLTILTLQKVCQ